MGDDTDTQTDSQDSKDERRFTQDDLERYVAKAHKTLRKELESRPTSDQVQELQDKYNALIEEKELEGKSEHEKIKHTYQRELEKLTAKLGTFEEQLKAKDAAVQEAQKALEAEQQTLKQERLSRTFGAALQKADVISMGADDALKVLLMKLRDVDIDDRGVRASYGKDLIEEEPEKIAQRFLQDHPFFTSVKGGGAGTQMPNGHPSGKQVHDLTQDQLWEVAGDFPATGNKPQP